MKTSGGTFFPAAGAALLGLGLGAVASFSFAGKTPEVHLGKTRPANLDGALASRTDPSAAAPWVPLPPPERDSFGQRWKEGKVITGGTPHRLILFTFDDGPNLETTPKLLDYLDAAGVRAVFFLTAERMLGNNDRELAQRQIAQEIVRRGHMVASHTVRHVSLFSLDIAEIDNELAHAEQIFLDVLGGRPFLFRPPGGNHSPRTDQVVEARQYTQVLWNLGTGDTQVRTPEAVLDTWKKVLERREREHGERGGVVLLHDLHEHAVEAFPLIVEELWRRNCELLNDPEEELYDVVDDPSFFFIPREPGDIGAIAPLARIPEEIRDERQASLRIEATLRCAAPGRR